jgi:flagella basal body P-ring formation protein FlgA
MLLSLLVPWMAPQQVEAPPAPVAVEEGARLLSARLVEAALAFAQTEAARLPGSYRIRLVQTPLAPRIAQGIPRIEVSHMSKKDPSGRFFVTLKVLVDGRLAGYSRVDLEGTWSGNLLRAKENLPRKGVPAPQQLELAAFEGLPPAGAIGTFPEGYRLRQPVQAGRYITQADLESIPLVKAGDRVRLTAHYECLSITTDGVARNSAARGERVRVELNGTRKLVQGQVSGEGEVHLAGYPEAK